MSHALVQQTASRLAAYCRAENWAGYDPYDALNSRILTLLPVLDTRIPRLVLTQALKRSPINVRALALIPKTQNPKGLALFLAASLKLSKAGLASERPVVDTMIERLIALRSSGTSDWCWGYSFAWQTRTMVVPRGTPNLVCTTFVASALLDAYEAGVDARCLEMATSAANYILRDLYRTGEEGFAGFSYPLPSMPARVHNANLLGAALLVRVARLTGETRFIEPALKVARYSAGRQREDGSWLYGEEKKQAWVDNFHTGFNLGALKDLNRDLASDEFTPCIERGFAYYRAHFFREDGAPRYFHDNTYPIDVHAVAQSLITLTAFPELGGAENRALAHSVFDWAMRNMWDERGFFYYRVLRLTTIRTSYMRWGQAWMLLGLACLLESDAQ